MLDFYINDALGFVIEPTPLFMQLLTFLMMGTKGAGFYCKKRYLAQNLIKRPTRPFVAIVGGSKVSGKLQALKNLLPKVDAYNWWRNGIYFFKSFRFEIGNFFRRRAFR